MPRVVRNSTDFLDFIPIIEVLVRLLAKGGVRKVRECQNASAGSVDPVSWLLRGMCGKSFGDGGSGGLVVAVCEI